MANLYKWPSIDILADDLLWPFKKLADVDESDADTHRDWIANVNFVPLLSQDIVNKAVSNVGKAGLPADVVKRVEKSLTTRACFSKKYDGTNVGIDCEGEMYGRNMMIQKGADDYQKTSLKHVKTCDVQAIRDKLLKAVEEAIAATAGGYRGEDHVDIVGDLAFRIAKTVVYGELMCNSNIYGYAAQKLQGQFCVFGAMVEFERDDKAATAETEEGGETEAPNPRAARFAELLGDEAGFATRVLESNGSRVLVMMNQKFKGLVDGVIAEKKSTHLTVPILAGQGLHDLLTKGDVVAEQGAANGHALGDSNGGAVQVDDCAAYLAGLKQGADEGYVVTIPESGSRCVIRKLKNGFETSSTLERTLENSVTYCERFGDRVKEGVVKLLEGVVEHHAVGLDMGAVTDDLVTAFSSFHAQQILADLVKMLRVMVEIAKQKERVTLSAGRKKESNTDAEKPTRAAKAHQGKLYADAIASAQTKYDSPETYWKTGDSDAGFNAYAELIVIETLVDVGEAIGVKCRPGAGDDAKLVGAFDAHSKRVTGILRGSFTKWKQEQQCWGNASSERAGC
jgi:hypothetical protein